MRALHCALRQRDVDAEVIVVDDGSTDGTSRGIRDRFGKDVLVVRHAQGRGVSAARNEGIERSSCDWVAFLDDDDVWSPDKLRLQLDTASLQERLWVYAGMVTVDAQLRILYGNRPDSPERIALDILVRNRLPSGPSNVVVHRDALQAVGGFDPALRYHEDWDMWLRLAELGPPAAVIAPLLAHVVHGGNAALDPILRDLKVIERRYAPRRGARRVDRGYVHRWIAGSYLHVGNRRSAARAYFSALAASPVRSLTLGARAVFSPRAGARTAYRPPPARAWRKQAESWLAPLRAELAREGIGRPAAAVDPCPTPD
jgi:glycosyltransferase involved in cell wall biosynthesis